MPFFKKDKLQIITFQSYGTPNKLHLRGRALEDESINLESKSFWSLLRNSYKRFETDEIRDEKLKIALPDNQIIYTTTNHEGYFNLDKTITNLDTLINSEGWLPYEISYENYKDKLINNNNRFGGEMLIPPSKAEYGIISDVDDTILETGVVSTLKWQVIVNSVFKSVTGRKAFEGAANLYHKMHLGVSGDASNPVFYVSNSPWNLYRYLNFFLESNNFPKGSILLRDFRAPFEKRTKQKLAHKPREIRNILTTYPNLNFILIGDAGEHDADIYLDVVKNHPERILAIFIRSVNNKKRMLRIQNLFETYTEVPVQLFKNSKEVTASLQRLNLL